MTPDERIYYNRQLRLPGFGVEGQERLRRSSALIVGVGGLGCPAALYLAAAGVGHLTLVDFDRVQASNLHRQILFTIEDIGMAKAGSARRRLQAANPHVDIQALEARLDEDNALALVRTHDIVLDASDNFATRYLLNEACLSAGRPLVLAAILGFRGQLAVFNYRGGPCYRCLFPEPPTNLPNCNENGVIGALPGVLGASQAMEAIKILIDHEKALRESFLTYDALGAEFMHFHARRDPNCRSCGERREPLARQPLIEAQRLREWLITGKRFFLYDVRSHEEHNEGAIESSVLFASDRLPSPDELIVLYCQSGVRSRQFALRLRAQGYTNVMELAGGFSAWQASVGEQRPAGVRHFAAEEPRKPTLALPCLNGLGNETGPDL